MSCKREVWEARFVELMSHLPLLHAAFLAGRYSAGLGRAREGLRKRTHGGAPGTRLPLSGNAEQRKSLKDCWLPGMSCLSSEILQVRNKGNLVIYHGLLALFEEPSIDMSGMCLSQNGGFVWTLFQG